MLALGARLVETRGHRARARSARRRIRRPATLLAALLVAACHAADDERAQPPTPTPLSQPSPPSPPSFGYLDTSVSRTIRAAGDRVSGWALDPDGVAAVELVAGDGRRWPLEAGIARPDVEAVHPGHPDSPRAGFDGRVPRGLIESGTSHVEVVVTDRRGDETVLAEPLAIGPHRERWRELLDERPGLAARRFHVLFATSNVPRGGAAGIDTAFAAHTSETLRVGVRVPILYMRTTRGPAADWVFDADFDTTRVMDAARTLDPQPGRDAAVDADALQVVEDSLAATARHAVAHDLPVLFTLNGGVWGDARGTAPEWDLTDHLEETPANCQWNDLDEVAPDDDPGLPGAIAGVELGRALTLNVFADEVRRYKRRNLQQAGAWVARFAAEHPALFVGVNLDPDVYMNPFFEGDQWYDYNPDTLRQFRHWLRGDGPYAGVGPVDLSAYRRSRPLSLEAFNRAAGTRFATWAEVDAPRLRRDPVPRFWDLPLFQIWERFRRHVVDLHYDELSTWLAESGVPPARIFSSQGFMPRRGLVEPFPVSLDDDTRNYDSGGMTLEGALPRDGHIGAIVYGDSATNTVEMTSGQSLFATLRAWDPGWAIVEFNPADLRAPDVVPGHEASYRALRDAFNYGARFVSPMSWNGVDGAHRDHPAFVSFMAVRRTPLEDAIRFFLDDRADLPRGALLWPFGDFRHPDDDGWRIERGAASRPTPGAWVLEREAGAREIVVRSPPDLPLDPRGHDLLVLGVHVDAGRVEGIAVEGRAGPGDAWRAVVEAASPLGRRREPAGVRLPLRLDPERPPRELRLAFALSDEVRRLRLEHVLVYPAADPASDPASDPADEVAALRDPGTAPGPGASERREGGFGTLSAARASPGPRRLAARAPAREILP